VLIDGRLLRIPEVFVSAHSDATCSHKAWMRTFAPKQKKNALTGNERLSEQHHGFEGLRAVKKTLACNAEWANARGTENEKTARQNCLMFVVDR